MGLLSLLLSDDLLSTGIAASTPIDTSKNTVPILTPSREQLLRERLSSKTPVLGVTTNTGGNPRQSSTVDGAAADRRSFAAPPGMHTCSLQPANVHALYFSALEIKE